MVPPCRTDLEADIEEIMQIVGGKNAGNHVDAGLCGEVVKLLADVGIGAGVVGEAAAVCAAGPERLDYAGGISPVLSA